MQLVGMLDSPYVRRVAVALLRLELPFEHRPISLFRHIDEFVAINPLLKTPTLVADDGTVLMDSGLIIEYAAMLAARAESLAPRAPGERLRAARSIGLSMAVCEKAVQFHYERVLRPPEKRHEPWAGRVRGQLLAGLDALEFELGDGEGWLFEERMTLADITLACAFAFTQSYLGDIVEKSRYAAIARLSARAERTPEFLAAPALDGPIVRAPLRPPR